MDENKLKNEPVHKHIDTVHVVVTKEVIFVVPRAGGEVQVLSFAPAHAKRLLTLLTKKIGEYEKDHGELDGKLATALVLSPIQDVGGEKS